MGVRKQILNVWQHFSASDKTARSITSVVCMFQVLHTLCDGSPTHMEDKVADALDIFNYDSDPKIRRQAHKVLSGYRRTGKWNVMWTGCWNLWDKGLLQGAGVRGHTIQRTLIPTPFHRANWKYPTNTGSQEKSGSTSFDPFQSKNKITI